MTNPIWTHRAGSRLAREAAAAAKLAERASAEFWAPIQAAEQRRQDERAALAVNAAKAEEERRSASCPCPTCSGGTKTLSIAEAAFVMSALSHFRGQGLAATPRHVELARFYAANPTYEVHGDAVVPRGGYDNAPDIGAMLAAQAPIEMGENTDAAADSDEAALAQLDAKPAKPSKAVRRHVAPPFLDDGDEA